MAKERQAEEQLAELWFDALASASTIGVFRTEFGRGLVWVNDRYLEIIGRSRTDVVGESWTHVVHPDDLPAFADLVARARHDPQPLQHEFRIRRPGGTTRWVRIRAAPVSDDGEVIGYAGVLEDLSDVVATAREAARLAAACQTTSDLIAITDASGLVCYLNPAGRTVLGLDPHRALELSTTDLYTPSSFARVQTEMLSGLIRESRWSGELALRARDGASVPVSLVATLERGDGDDGDHVVVVARDIRAERALVAEASRSDAQFRLLAEASPFGIVEIDEHGRIAYVNERYCELVGRTANDVRELLADGSLIHPHDRQTTIEAIASAFLEQRPLGSVEHRLARSDGTVIWARARTTPIMTDDGRFHGYVATVEDISAEVTERRGIDRLLQMFDATPDYASIVDGEGHVLFMNPAARELFGLGCDADIEGLDYRSCYTRRSLELIEGEGAPALEERGVWTGEVDLVAADGREVPVSQTTVTSRADDGSVWYASISRDISELKQAEAQIAKSEAWFRTLLQHLTDFVVVQAADGHVLYMSPSIERVLGYSRSELLAADRDQWEAIHPDDLAAVREADRRARSEPAGTASVEYRVRHKDGSWRWLDVTVQNLLDDLSVRGVVINGTDITEERNAREAQARSEAALRAVVLQSPLAIYAIDQDGTTRLWNRAAEEMFGYAADDVVGHMLPIVRPDEVERFAEFRDRVIDGEVVRGLELERERQDGSPISVSLSAAPVRDATGEVATVMGVFADVTDRKRAEEALRRSEERFRALVTHASDLVLVFDRDGTLSYASPSALSFSGFGIDVPLNDRLEAVHPDDLERVRATLESVLENGGTSGLFEARVRDHSGELRWLEIVATNLLDDPAVQGIVLNARDVSEGAEAAAALREVNEALRQSNEALSAVIDNSPVAIYSFDPDGVIEFWNPACEAIFGFSADEAVGRPSPVIRDVDLGDAAAVRHRVMNGEVVQPVEARQLHKDGRVLDVMFAAAPMRGDGGEVVSVLALSSDVTSEKEHERALLENEARFRALAEHASVIITILEVDGTIRYTSASVGRILGHQEGANEGINVFEHVHPDDRDVTRELFDGLIADPDRTRMVRVRVRHADGSWRDLEAVGNNLVSDPAVGGVLITARDVTEQMEAERALRASEERFRALVQNLSDIVTIVDDDGSVRWTSPAVGRVLGYSSEEAIRPGPFGIVHPDDREQVVRIVAQQLREPGPHEPFTFRLRHADGSWRQFESVIDDLRDNPAIGGLVITSRDATESKESEERLAASEARYRSIVEDQTELICRYDRTGAITFVNEAYARYFGASVDELVGQRHSPFIPEDDHAQLRRALMSLGPKNPSVTVEHRILRPDGVIRRIEWTHRVVIDGAGTVTEFGALGRDVTEQREAEALVRDQARILEMIAWGAPLAETLSQLCEVVETHAPDVVCAVLLVDETMPDQLNCGAAPSLPGTFVEALAGVPIAPRAGSCGTAAYLGEPVVVTDIETDPLWTDFRDLALSHGLRAAWSSPIKAPSSDNVLGTFCLYSHEARSPSRRHEQLLEMVVHHAAIAIERKQFESQLAHQAHHDPLTTLPNRVLFMEFLVLALARARRYRSTVAVLFLDLDRFKIINDSLGHDTGDELLGALGERLRSVLRPGDTVARFGGDEFTVLCEDLSGPQAKQQAVEVAERLLDVIHQPFLLDGEEHFLSASIGIALASSGDDQPDALLRDADAAMYRAKERGKGRWELFDESMRQTALRRLEIENSLHRAIDRGEFRVFYQPCISIPDGRCVGAEALVRWQHPERGLVAPMEFIGLAEETGLVVPLGRWVLEEACGQAARWCAERTELDQFQVSVNLSGRQLGHPELVEQVASALERASVDPGLLCLEITESVLMDDVDATIATLARLKALGVKLSIDDFGTGYSSLGYLKRFPVDFVKVDQSFVGGLGTDPEDSAIVAAVVSLGHALDLRVVAEGVETELQLSELAALGCDQAQGYLFAPPQPALELHDTITSLTRWQFDSGLR